MRIHYVLALAALLTVSAASEEPEIFVTASFPENNPGHVTNGEKNIITLIVENKSKQNVTLINVAGSFLHPDTDSLVKNTTPLPYNSQLVDGVKVSIPYTFYSEFKPGDLRLRVWVEHQADVRPRLLSLLPQLIGAHPEPKISGFSLRLDCHYS